MNTKFLKYFNKFEKIIIILILLYSGGAWLFRPAYFATTEYGIGKMATPINLGIYAITSLLIIIRWKHFIYALTKEKLLMLTIAIVICSVLWSVSPESSLNSIKGLIRVTALGIYIAVRYSLKEQINILAWTFGIAAVASLVYCLVFPDLGIQPNRFGETAGWRGIFFHKNHFGRQMSFGSALFLLLALKKHQYHWFHWTLFTISFTLLLLSNSKTALLCFVISASLLPIAAMLRQSIKIILVIFPYILLFFGGLIVSVLLNLEIVLNALGKDITLTGRIPVWAFLLEKLAEEPWLGYGQSAFWNTISDDTGYLYSFNWKFGHAHNGFLEVALSIGIIGVSLFLVSFIIAYLKAIALMRLANTAEYLWPLQFLTIIISTNLTVGSTFLEPSTYWMLYVTTLFSLSLEFDRLRKTNSISSTPKISFDYVN